jgi:DNA-binding beta-propeller fold protein YncE
MTGITAEGLLTVAVGETAATLTVTATSVYDDTQSASTTVTVAAAATAVEKTQSVSALTVYPNPATGVVYVENEGNSEVALYSVKGELLLRTVGSVVDLSALPSGVYVVKVGAKAAKVVKK